LQVLEDEEDKKPNAQHRFCKRAG